VRPDAARRGQRSGLNLLLRGESPLAAPTVAAPFRDAIARQMTRGYDIRFEIAAFRARAAHGPKYRTYYDTRRGFTRASNGGS
jgi:hypothetical protein